MIISTQIIREYTSVTLRNARYLKIPLETSIRDILDDIAIFKRDFNIIREKTDTLDHWLALLPQIRTSKDVHDFNIAATLKSAAIQHILTHNVSDFDQFVSWLSVLPLINT